MNLNVFFVILAIYAGGNLSLDFEPKDLKAGLTFVKLSKARISYDTYTILYYVDISQYKNITKSVETFLKAARQENNRLNYSKVFKSLLDQATVLLDHMKRDEADIEAYQQKIADRKKRALEFVGDFFHWAFGTMNADTAREYDRKIEYLHNDTNRIHNIIQEQTVLIKETLALNNKSYTDLQTQLNVITDRINFYKKELFAKFNWLDTEVSMLGSISMVKMLEAEHQRVSIQIMRCLEDTVSGKITQLIPQDRLIEDLRQVSKFLKEDQKLPIDLIMENPLHVFKYSKIVSTLYGNRIMIEINIPIVERGIYTIYEIIPIPTMIDNNTVIIKPSMRYVLLNDGHKEFIPITPREYFKSKFNLQGERIIKPAENAIIDFSQNCEISIMMNPNVEILEKYCDIRSIPTSNYFISLNSNDAFYLCISKPLQITEYCQHLTGQPHQIKESGILVISKECRVVTDKISLRPRNNYKYNSKQVITLSNHTVDITFKAITEKMKRSINISIPKRDENVLIQDLSGDFDMLVEKADKLIERSKSEQKWSNIQFETAFTSKKSYAFTSFMTLITMTLTGLVAYYFYKKFFNVETWVKLADVLGRGNVNRVPHLFVRNN